MKRIALLTLVLLAGCGGSRTSAPEPRLPAPLAARLATYADETARLAAAGDACGARRQALALQHATVAAINAHRVPGPLQEPLQTSANDLVNRIACTPPPVQTTTTGPSGEGNGNGEKHGKGKGHGKKGEE
ncbi:MAG TPA: hypothetical protein VIM23_13225 [Gaiellaceae bacterium]|jgi:hypothetical protein